MRTNEQIAAHAAALHRQAIVIDGHSDILMSVADGKVRLGAVTTNIVVMDTGRQTAAEVVAAASRAASASM